jgi:hypothetical protein
MWRITTRGFTLEEILIMAAMNLLASGDSTFETRDTSVAEPKRRPSEEVKYLPNGDCSYGSDWTGVASAAKGSFCFFQ